jgi:hypothetical protein
VEAPKEKSQQKNLWRREEKKRRTKLKEILKIGERSCFVTF